MTKPLCITCQYAGAHCPLGQPFPEPPQCDHYRAWTREALHHAQLAAAQHNNTSAWRELCRLIEIERRLLGLEAG